MPTLAKQEDKSVTKEKSHGSWYHNLTIVLFATFMTLLVLFFLYMRKDDKVDTVFYEEQRDPEMWVYTSPSCGHNLTSQ